MSVRLLSALAIAAILSGCERDSSLEAPQAFFAANKSGSSPDYGVIKWNDPEHHVITVHGFMDDLKTCLIIVDALNKDACSELGGSDCLDPFSCQPLNH